MTIQENIREYIIDNFFFGDDDGSLQENTSFRDENVLDSMGILELIEFLETTYAIKVEDDEMIPENLDSLNAIATFVESKKGA